LHGLAACGKNKITPPIKECASRPRQVVVIAKGRATKFPLISNVIIKQVTSVFIDLGLS